MRVLVITGDKRFGPGHPRYDIQRAAVADLVVLYWGGGALIPAIPQGSFDVVTTQDPFWRGLVGWYVANKLQTKFNVQVHADIAAQSLIKHLIAQVVLKHAHSVRVVSEKIKQQVQAWGVKVPIQVLPVYVDVSRFRMLARRPHSPKNILWVGRFEEEKDPLLAIQVLQEVVRSEPQVQLIMLGDGSLRKRLERYTNYVPLLLPGWQDSAQYLEIADVVLSTSREESFGASIVEALAAGVPVVAPDVGVAREAGATIVSRTGLAQATLQALLVNEPGQLKLQLPTAAEWAALWKQSLQ